MNPPNPTNPPPPPLPPESNGPPKPPPVKGPGRALQAQAIFEAAVGRPKEVREAYVAAVCGGDDSLRAEVMLLLNAAEGAWNLMGEAQPSPEAEAEFARLKPEEAGDRIGRYKLLEQIGEGGFGAVWVADQEMPVKRRVALKIIKLGMDTKEVIARFEQERQALAMMDHPNIAKVLDAGATEWGRPFFVMELVRGIKITNYCDKENLPTDERLKLFVAVCHAVQHAHQKGIIHRDLKPSNILVTLHDGVPVPKIIDFGIAKATHGRLTDLTIYTQFQQMIGTPLYMSPEQAEMSGLDVDTRSDIYSLGVLLYELLTGRTPVAADTLKRVGLDEIRRIIREQESPRPSTALNTMGIDDRTKVAHRRQLEPPKLVGLLRGDLDSIAMKALEKDRTHRYETANGLAMDVQRFLASEPVVARPTSQLYRFGRMARRNKAVFLSVTTVFLVVLIGGTIAGWQALLAQRRLKELRATAPDIAAVSRQLVMDQRFEEALRKIDSAISLDRQNPDYLVQSGDLLQAMQRLPEAADCYRRALALRHEDTARKNLNLCEKLLRDNGQQADLSIENQRVLLNELLAQERYPEAVPLATLLNRGAEVAEGNIRRALRLLDYVPDFDWASRLKRLPDKTYSLDLRFLPIKELPQMNGLLITELYLSNTKIESLASLRGLSLRSLELVETRVRDLSPLRGIPLESLVINGTGVTDLTPLHRMPLQRLLAASTLVSDLGPLTGMPLEELGLNETSCSDISPLQGMSLRRLHLSGMPIRDLTLVRGMPLEVLDIRGTKVTDLAPIAGMPLRTLDIGGLNAPLEPLLKCPTLETLALPTPTSDIAFLRDLTNIRNIDAGKAWRDVKKTSEVFWDEHEKQFAARRPIDLVLKEMGVADSSVRATLLSDGTIDLDLSGLSVSDLSPLHGLPIQRLNLARTPVSDLSPLVGMPLRWLSLSGCARVTDFATLGKIVSLEELDVSRTNLNDLRAIQELDVRVLRIQFTPVRDLSPLRGKNLEALILWGSSVDDVGPLIGCPKLVSVQLPSQTGAHNVERLRSHPSLRRLGYILNSTSPFVEETVQEFWAYFLRSQPSGDNRVSDTVKRISELWEGGKSAEAIAQYHQLAASSAPESALKEAQMIFARANWSVVWFPNAIDPKPKGNLATWRKGATDEKAVSARVSSLAFNYRMEGPRSLGLTSELSSRGPDAENFGMSAKAQVKLPAGCWRFHVKSDDGFRLLINGTAILEHWDFLRSVSPNDKGWIQPEESIIEVVAEHFQDEGWAEFQLSLEPIKEPPNLPAGPLGQKIKVALISMNALDKAKRVAITNEGLLELDLRDAGVQDLEPLRDLPIGRLVLSGNPIKDLSPLRGKAIRELRITGTKVTDLAPLEGMPLEWLTCGDCKTLSDISPLKGCVMLKALSLAGTFVHDLSPMLELPRLEWASMPQSASDIGILRRHPSLQFLGWEGDWDPEAYRPSLTVAEFWQRFDEQSDAVALRARLSKAGWRGFKLKVRPDQTYQLRTAARYDIADLSPLAGAPISELYITDNPVTSLEPLRGMPLRRLWLIGAQVSDLEPLRGLPLDALCLARTNVTDLSPLVGMPLRGLFIDGNPQLKNLAPLAEIRTLEDVILPSSDADPTPLRSLPNLKFLGHRFAGGPEGTGNAKPVSQFWIEYDAKAASPER